MTNQPDAPLWRDGEVPVSPRFDDPYFSLENGLAETRHTFLAGNDLPARFGDGFHVAELGFGTGLNLLATLHLWRESGIAGQLLFTSFEAFPMTGADMIRAQSAFPELSAIADELAPFWRDGVREIDLPDGSTGSFDLRESVSADSASGLLKSFLREAATTTNGMTQKGSEAWTLSCAVL